MYKIFFIFLFLINNCIAQTTMTIQSSNFINSTNTSFKFFKARRSFPTTNSINVVMYSTGGVRQTSDYLNGQYSLEEKQNIRDKKLSFKTRNHLQLENLYNINGLTIYRREWQFPINSSLLIAQYKTDEFNLPDFDNPKYYSLSATSNTIISIKWIRNNFTPYQTLDENKYVFLKDNTTTQSTKIKMFIDGSMKQERDYFSDEYSEGETSNILDKKLYFSTKSHLQLEDVSDKNILSLYNRDWQLPKNSSLLVIQYPVDELGIPVFDNPKYYALSATSNTLISLKWIQRNFSPYQIPLFHMLHLTWTPNSEEDLKHYNIYRKTEIDDIFIKINTEPITNNWYFDFDNLQEGKTFYYAATAVDTNNNESGKSNTASAKIP